MSRSLNSYQKKKIKEAHNDTCDICTCKREKKYLIIHHIKTNESHSKYNHKSNLMVLCNDYTETKCHNELHLTLTSGEGVNYSKHNIKNEIDVSEDNAALLINAESEQPCRKWFQACILSDKPKNNGPKKFLKSKLIYGGAEVFDISDKTTRGYLKKICSFKGPLKEYKDQLDHKWYVRFRLKGEID